jgi:hypothetical protein
VEGAYERCDEPSCSGVMELVMVHCFHNLHKFGFPMCFKFNIALSYL